MDLKLEDHFKNTWLNSGYTQAVNFILKTDRDSVPSPNVLLLLVEFVLVSQKLNIRSRILTIPTKKTASILKE
jgi:hypothetical protein